MGPLAPRLFSQMACSPYQQNLCGPKCVVVRYASSPRRRHLIEPLAILFGDLDSCRAQVVLKLLHRARPDDGAGYARLLLAPRERNLPRGAPFSVAIASTTSTTSKAFPKWLRPIRLGSRPYLDPSGDASSSGTCRSKAAGKR